MFDFCLLGVVFDGVVFFVFDEMMEYFVFELLFFIFGVFGVVWVLSMYGRIVFVDCDFFVDFFSGFCEEGIEICVVGFEGFMVFLLCWFGLVYCWWMLLEGSVLCNLICWLKFGGVLLVEQGDDYLVWNLLYGLYCLVLEVVVDWIWLFGGVDFLVLLICYGFMYVGCRYQVLLVLVFYVLFQYLVEWGVLWLELIDVDLLVWLYDLVVQILGFVNVIVWGLKNIE